MTESVFHDKLSAFLLHTYSQTMSGTKLERGGERERETRMCVKEKERVSKIVVLAS